MPRLGSVFVAPIVVVVTVVTLMFVAVAAGCGGGDHRADEYPGGDGLTFVGVRTMVTLPAVELEPDDIVAFDPAFEFLGTPAVAFRLTPDPIGVMTSIVDGHAVETIGIVFPAHLVFAHAFRIPGIAGPGVGLAGKPTATARVNRARVIVCGVFVFGISPSEWSMALCRIVARPVH
jgi:hypothetical protein